MHNDIRAEAFEQIDPTRLVDHIGDHELGGRMQRRRSCSGRVHLGMEVVEHHPTIGVRRNKVRNRAADEAGASRHENCTDGQSGQVNP